MMTHHMQYLRNAYLQLLNADPNKPISFQKCCKEAIKNKNWVGIRTITNSKTVMQWNLIFRVKENVPHPNIFIEMDTTYRSPFLDTFPVVKLQIVQWSIENIGNTSCEWRWIKCVGFLNCERKKKAMRDIEISSLKNVTNLRRICTDACTWLKLLQLN